MGRQIETNIAVQFSNRDQMSVLLRLFMVIPAAIFLSSFASSNWVDSSNDWRFYASGFLAVPAFLAIVFRGKYPTYVYSFNHALLELNTRVTSYLLLLTDSYPSIEASESVEIVFPEITAEQPLNPVLPLIKWFLAIPLYIVGAFYGIYAFVLTIIAWFTILATSEYPAWCARPVAGTIAFWNRVMGYAFLLVTDDYPTFSL